MSRIRNRTRNPGKLKLDDTSKESGTPMDALVARQIAHLYGDIR